MDGTAAEALEERLAGLHAAVRRAALAGDGDRARDLRAELDAARQDWEAAVALLKATTAGDPFRPGPLLTVREQVHEALSLLGVPTQARLLVKVHDAFFAAGLQRARLTSLRRDEEKSFATAAPGARPYYLCAALSAEHLSPSRGLLAISAWPLERRVIGPQIPDCRPPRRRDQHRQCNATASHAAPPGHRAARRGRRQHPRRRLFPGLARSPRSRSSGPRRPTSRDSGKPMTGTAPR